MVTVDAHTIYAPDYVTKCVTTLLRSGATNVGGMAAHLGDYAALTPRRDADAMSRAILVIAALPEAARRQARRGRDYVCREWSRDKAFVELRRSLMEAATGVIHQTGEGEVAA